jgi:hypothetical protein
VPSEAAWDFLMGHINANIGILFGFIDAQVSDGAKLAVERAKRNIMQSDWKKVFEKENLLKEGWREEVGNLPSRGGLSVYFFSFLNLRMGDSSKENQGVR